MTFSEKFSKDVCDGRQRMGLTQSQVAEKLGISLRHYQNIEYGKKKPGAELMLKLFLELRLNMEDYRDLFGL